MLCCFQAPFFPQTESVGSETVAVHIFFCLSAPDGSQQGPSGDKEEGAHAGPLGVGDKVTFCLSLGQTGQRVTG